MTVSIRTVLLLVFFCAGSTLSACGKSVDGRDRSAAGVGGESDGAGGSAQTAGAIGGTGSGAGPGSGGTPGVGAGGSAQAGTQGGESSEAGAGGDESSETGGRGGESAEAAGSGGSTEAGAGTGGSPDVPPYPLRTGPFQMLVYSRTNGFEHQSISAGQEMLAEIAAEQGFEVVLTATNEDITPEGLSKYEIVFFLNTSGDVFNETEQQAFEDWMTTREGAYAGVHSATNTEHEWQFYEEIVGQRQALSAVAGVSDHIVIEASERGFVGMASLPNPWSHTEEWLSFDEHEVWSAKPGFRILARRAADNQPVSWIREYANFRSFYTVIGHDAEAFQEEPVKTHVAAGIMWAVRREHLFQ